MQKLGNLAAILAIFINSILGALSQLPPAYAQETSSTSQQSVSSQASDQSETAPSPAAQTQPAEISEEIALQSTSNENSSDQKLNDSPSVNTELSSQEKKDHTSSNLLETIINQFKRLLSTDKADYPPESTVKITGSGFEPNQTLTIRVTWPDGTVRASGNRAGDTDQLTADSSGNLHFDYLLTAGQEGAYQAEILSLDGQVLATASFTDDHEEEDSTPPQSTFTSPQDGSFWGTDGVSINGSSTDVPDTTVDYVTFWASLTGEEDWFQIDEIENEDEDEPFYWSFTWFPDEEGTYDILAEATDTAGNVENSPVVEEVTYDVTAPTSHITYPEENQRYIEDVWAEEIRGTASDSPSSGVATVLVSIQRDSDGLYWDGEDWSTGEDDSEILNEADFDEEDGSFSYEFDFTVPEGDDQGYTARSHALDNASNLESTNVVQFFFGRAPIISTETSSLVTTSSVTITWTTDFPATSRVVYDTAPHPELGGPPSYGYANSTAETDTDPKVTSHSQTIDGLTSGANYFYRTISRGSPEAVGDEKTFTTASAPSSAGPSSSAPGPTGPASPPSCNDQKPGSAPLLIKVTTGTNSVILTWSQAQDPVSYYLITYGTSPGVQQFGNPNVGGRGTTSYTVNGLSGGTTYYFKVRAGNGCAPGDFSNELSATPGGGLVTAPAAGFTPGVLSSQAQVAIPSAEASPSVGVSPSALGEEAKVKGARNWAKIIITLAVVFGGAGMLFWFFTKKVKRT